jgi:hypothetical protein
MPKSFKDTMQQKAAVNPTLQFITPPEDQEEPITESKPKRASASSSSKSRRKAAPTPPPAHRAQTQYGEEAKSRRLQLLLTPSLYEAVKARAAEERRSVNDFINAALWDTIRK